MAGVTPHLIGVLHSYSRSDRLFVDRQRMSRACYPRDVGSISSQWPIPTPILSHTANHEWCVERKEAGWRRNPTSRRDIHCSHSSPCVHFKWTHPQRKNTAFSFPIGSRFSHDKQNLRERKKFDSKVQTRKSQIMSNAASAMAMCSFELALSPQRRDLTMCSFCNELSS